MRAQCRAPQDRHPARRETAEPILKHMPTNMTAPLAVSVVLFEGFELLDVFGPVELLAMVPGVTITYVGAQAEAPIASSQGARVLAQRSYEDLAEPGLLLVPGGQGTRSLVSDDSFLSWLTDRGQRASVIASVCTGSALLAAAGLLDGYRATSNKLAFEWAS